MNYYIRSQGNVYGPYETNTMLGFVKEGRVIANTEVSTDQINWTYAGHVTELFPPAVPQAPVAPATPVADPYGYANSSNPYGMQQPADPYGLSPMNSDPYGMQPMGQSDYGLAPTTSPQQSPSYGGTPGSSDVYGTAPVTPSPGQSYGAGDGGTNWDNVLGEQVSSGTSSYNPAAAPANPYSPPSGGYQPGYSAPKRSRRKSGNEGAATAALILGIVSILLSCCPFAGWICGGIGLSQASQGMDSNSQGLATAGKILCIIGIALSTLVFVLNIIVRLGGMAANDF